MVHFVLARLCVFGCSKHTKSMQGALISLCVIRGFVWEGGTRMARGGIRLVHGLTKSTIIMYFSDMKIDPKYAFLHAFFLICLL